MEPITHFLHQGASFIIPLIVLLGVLIFVHELGHFSVAKFFGVRVETFSLGFGRKILRKKWGDTVYAISAIPFGGYVKMFGDDPSAKVPKDQQKYSFNHQPVLPRIAIVLAGPAMNAFFAFFLFTVIAGVGEDALKAKLGDINFGTAAYNAGFRTGDVITQINGKEITRWEDVKKQIEENNDRLLAFDISREGKIKTINATPILINNKNVLSTKEKVGDIPGLTYLLKAPSIGVMKASSVAASSGLKTGDIIKKINGADVDTFDQLKTMLASKATLEIERPQIQKNLTITLPEFNKFEDLGIESSELYLSSVVPKSGADLAGIQPGDRLVAINGKKVDNWENVVSTVQGFTPDKKSLRVEYSRNGKSHTAEITPQFVSQPDAAGIEQKTYALGVVTGLALASPHVFLAKEKTFGSMLVKGFDDTVRWTKLTALSFLKLVQRKVSAKNIGGPLMIGKLASETWKIGLSPFLKIMAIISINLFVLNLLPIPVLDGGHLLFFGIELVKGSPLSFRKLEIMQQVGMALLLALMVFSMFNDIVRLFSS